MKHVKYLFMIFIFLFVFILLVQNNEAFSTKIMLKADLKFAGQYQAPELNIYLLSTISFILGVLIIWVYDLLERMQLRKQIKKLRNEINEKDKELNSLRNLPIVSESMTPGIQEDDLELT